MIKRYFFVPLSNKIFIQKIANYSVDFIIYDLEDSIGEDSYISARNNIGLIERKGLSWLRLKIDWQHLDLNEIVYFREQGFRNFVIPKATGTQYLSPLFENKHLIDCQFIILVENPQILFDIKHILALYNKQIHGIALGSHDYCSAMKAKYEYESYRFAHDYILTMANCFSVVAIDVASMNIEDEHHFQDEVLQGFNKGYRSKFIIHPNQLEYLKKIRYFDDDEIRYARLVTEKFNLDKDFNAVEFQGRVLERPHIERIKEILKYLDYGIE